MKKIIAILAVVLVIGTSSSAFAAGVQNKTKEAVQSRISELQEKQKKIEDKKAEMDAKRAQYKTKREEFDAYREALGQKKEQMISYRKENMTLRQENNQLRVDLLNAIKAVKDSGTEIPAETQTKLNDYNQQIKDILAGIKDTKGDIQEIIKENKELFKNKDYIALDAAFEQIYTIQQFRNGELKKINVILQEMVKLFANEI